MLPTKIGPYQIQRKIGQGGMGSVYLGNHAEDGHLAAIKLLPSDMAKRPGFRERFEAEIESLRKLEHPNIVQLYGFGEEAGQLFYAMEYVPGKNLQQEIDQGRRFTWALVVNIGIAVAEALRHAHLHGIIHRDIKPANIMIMEDGTTKLTDFGIARLYGMEGLTLAGGPLGTVQFMAPEQASSNEKITEQADIYALGGTLYSLLAGRPPFEAQSMLQLLDMHKRHTPLPVNQIAPDVPEELSVVISTMLLKSPKDRVASATMLIKSLTAVRDAVAFREQTIKTPASSQSLPVNQQNICTMVEHDPHSAQVPTVQLDDKTIVSDADLDQTLAANTPHEDDPDATLVSQEIAPKSASNELAQAEEIPGAEESQSMFMTTEQARQMDQKRLAEQARQEPKSIPLTPILLFVFGAILAGVIWYGSRPLSPDALLKRIDAMQDTSDSYERSVLLGYLREYEKRVDKNDPKLAEHAQLKDDLQVQELERKLRQRARFRTSHASSLSMVEQALLDAIDLIPQDPKMAMNRLKALQTLYVDPMVKRSKRDDRLLKVASRLHDRALQTLTTYEKNYLNPLNAHLDRAEQFLESNPQRAMQVAQAVVTLHGHQPWASAQIDRANNLMMQAKLKINAKLAN